MVLWLSLRMQGQNLLSVWSGVTGGMCRCCYRDLGGYRGNSGGQEKCKGQGWPFLIAGVGKKPKGIGSPGGIYIGGCVLLLDRRDCREIPVFLLHEMSSCVKLS